MFRFRRKLLTCIYIWFPARPKIVSPVIQNLIYVVNFYFYFSFVFIFFLFISWNFLMTISRQFGTETGQTQPFSTEASKKVSNISHNFGLFRMSNKIFLTKTWKHEDGTRIHEELKMVKMSNGKSVESWNFGGKKTPS